MSKSTAFQRTPATIGYIAFCLVGLAAMAYSTWHWYALQMGTMSSQAFCEVGGYFSCERVTTSAYGSLFGVPISVFGFLYLLALLILAFTQSVSARVLRILFVPALFFCLYLIAVLIFVLEAGCINCYLGYLGFFGAFACSWRVEPKSFFPVWMAVALWGFGIIGHALYITQVTQPPIKNAEELQRFSEFYRQLPVEEISLVSPFRFKPESSGPFDVTIVEFADYFCPACAELSERVMNRVKRMPGVQLVFYPFPLDATCYPQYEGDAAPGLRCDWTLASFCAQEQGRFWDLHEFLFESTRQGARPPQLNAQNLARLGINQELFQACRRSSETQERMNKVLQVGIDAEIQATPTFFINGRRHRGIVPFERMYLSIQEERKMAQE